MFYLSIDIAKTKIDCCLILENSTSKKKTKTFSNTQNGFEPLQICDPSQYCGQDFPLFL